MNLLSLVLLTLFNSTMGTFDILTKCPDFHPISNFDLDKVFS